MESSDGDARKKRKRGAPPSLALAPSMLVVRGDGGAPSARRRRHMDPGGGGAPAARRRGMGPGGGGAPTAGGTAAAPSFAPRPWRGQLCSAGGAEDGSVRGRGREANSGGGCSAGGGDNGWGALLEKVAPQSKISVAHTPSIPPRFQALLKKITFLIPYENKGKSHKCTLNQINMFRSSRKSEITLFFEWSDSEMEMNLWIYNNRRGANFKFTVNAAFPHEMNGINVERAVVAFSANFIGGDVYWSDLKNMLLNMFGFVEGEKLKEYEYLYVFTRVGGSLFFRTFKILSSPRADDPSSGFVLGEINTSFCLKPVDHQGRPNCLDIGPHETHRELNLRPVTMYTTVCNGQRGYCTLHSIELSETTYSIFLENGPYISSVEKLEGFNISLAEIVVKEPLLKIKQIIGSATNKEHCFARLRCKSILQSLFAECAILLESGKCFTGDIDMCNVLVRAGKVKLFGLQLTGYSEEAAEQNVVAVVQMVRRCFRDGEMPMDLDDLLKDLEKEPLNAIQWAKDDCSFLKAERRRSLFINLNSEYLTNVEERSSRASEEINQLTFFDGCPDVQDWELTMGDNEYMVQICNVDGRCDLETGDAAGQRDPAVVARMKRKEKMSKKNKSIRRMTKKRKQAPNRGKIQLRSMSNFLIRMPEKARQDGIFPFRLGISDYMLTSYFPRFLRFVQKRMRQVKAQREKSKKEHGV